MKKATKTFNQILNENGFTPEKFSSLSQDVQKRLSKRFMAEKIVDFCDWDYWYFSQAEAEAAARS